MQSKTIVLIFALSSVGVQADMPLENIVGGLNQFRDLAAALQPVAESITFLSKPSNAQYLQKCADGWSDALVGGTQFVQGIDGTPQVNDSNADMADAIYEAYSDCATAHKKLLKTLSDRVSGAGWNSAAGKQLAQTMPGIKAVINGLTADLIQIVKPGSSAAQGLASAQSGLVKGNQRCQACYSGNFLTCTSSGLQGY